MALVLSLDECIRANASLIKAVRSSDVRTLKDILTALSGSDVRNKLKVRTHMLMCTHPVSVKHWSLA